MNELGSPAQTSSVSAPNTHYVKQLTATYLRNAGLSLTGPTAIEEQQRGKYNRFKLADDVVISKVYREDNTNGDYSRKNANFENNEQVLEQLSKIALMRKYQEQMIQQAEKEGRDRSRDRQMGGGRSRQNSGQGDRGSAGHLSGEQIRKLRESQKAAERARQEEERRLREGRSDGKDPGRTGMQMSLKSAFKSPHTLPTTSCLPNPIMSASDRSWSELEDTNLEGEQISAFSVGGEYRLCLPQILNSVLEKVSLPAINQSCDELQIFCSTCSAEQLQVLKDAKVLPVAAHQCGLITKSDAERLVAHLLDQTPPRASNFNPKSSPFSFKVTHDCFGKCDGLVLPEAYTAPNARCVECLQCEGIFSPQKFVCHSHNVANRTCHWGFDSRNWQTYLRLSEDYDEEEKERHAKVMEDFKNRYSQLSISDCGPGKRRQEDDSYDKIAGSSKRKCEDPQQPGSQPQPQSPSQPPQDPYTAYAKAINYAKAKASLGWPWPPKPAQFAQFPVANYPTPGRTEDFRRPEEVSRNPASPGIALRDDRFGDSIVKYAGDGKEDSSGYRCQARISQPTLAEEISTVADALEGAPKHATETVLKILERLTQRLDKAERDRDMVEARHKELQLQYNKLEEELAKKRGELRELLRQDGRLLVPEKEEKRTETNGGAAAGAGASGGGGVVVLGGSGGAAEKEEPDEIVSGMQQGTAERGTNLTVIVARLGEGRTETDTARNTGSRLESFTSPTSSSTLPKLELQSPVSGLRSVEEPAPSSPIVVSVKSEDRRTEGEAGTIAVREEFHYKFQKHLNLKNKDPEDALQDRMIKMETELTALREALSNKKESTPTNGSNGLSSVQVVNGSELTRPLVVAPQPE